MSTSFLFFVPDFSLGCVARLNLTRSRTDSPVRIGVLRVLKRPMTGNLTIPDLTHHIAFLFPFASIFRVFHLSGIAFPELSLSLLFGSFDL